MDSIFCSFDQKLSLADISTLCKITNAVIPVPAHNHLIGNANLGLHHVLTNNKDYIQLKDALKTMVITILQKVEGNQLILKRPVIGKLYSIKNTGPFPWERGDTLTLLPPIFSQNQTRILSLGDWSLVLPIIVPTPVAYEINARLLCIALLSVHRNYGETKDVMNELRIVHYRDVTVTLPDVVNDQSSTASMKNACIAFSMIAALAPELVYTYIERLSLEDHSMLLIKCQELLTQRSRDGHNAFVRDNQSVQEELKKIRSVLTMVNQIHALVSEKTSFLVCDVSADNKLASCIFKD